MKNLTKISLAAAVIAASFSACTKDNSTTGTVQTKKAIGIKTLKGKDTIDIKSRILVPLVGKDTIDLKK